MAQRCARAGKSYYHGVTEAGKTEFIPGRNHRTDKVVCPDCGKKLKPQVLLGEVLSYNRTLLYSIVRYHKSLSHPL